MTLAEAKQLLALVAAAFPTMQERDLAPTAQAWVMFLGDVPAGLARAALQRVLSQSRYFPTVAEIRQAAAEISTPALPTATEALILLRQVVRGEIHADRMHPLAAYVVKSVGLASYRNSEEPERSYRDFSRQYEAERSKVMQVAALPADQKAKALASYPEAVLIAVATGWDDKLLALKGGEK